MSNVLRHIKKIFTGGSGSGSSSSSIYDISSAKFSGEYYDAFPATGVSTGSTGYWNGVISAIPFVVGETHTITDIRVEVIGTSAGNNHKMGIYTATAIGYPDALIEESGSIDCTASGLKTYTFASPITLTSTNRLYYVVICTQVAAISLRESTAIALLPSSGANRGSNWRSGAVGYGALPATFPAATINTAVPVIKFRKQ